jgi:hypothetical protein
MVRSIFSSRIANDASTVADTTVSGKQECPSKLFTLNLRGLLGKQSQTVQERVEPLSRPSAEATEEGHAGLGAGGAARAATDFARNDQRAHAALGQIVVRRRRRSSPLAECGTARALHRGKARAVSAS